VSSDLRFRKPTSNRTKSKRSRGAKPTAGLTSWLERAIASVHGDMRGWPRWKRLAMNYDPVLGLRPNPTRKAS